LKPSIPTSETFQSNDVDHLTLEARTVILQAVDMEIPNSQGVYFINNSRPKKKINYKTFLSRYADHPRRIRVCFDGSPSANSLVERSERVTAYSSGLDCWYIVESDKNEPESTYNASKF